MQTFQTFLVIDAQGDYACGTDTETALQAYADNIGDIADSNGFRIVCVNVKATLPAPTELDATAPDDTSAAVS